MARGRELKVYLTSDVSKFGKGLKQAESRVTKFRKIAAGALAGVAAAAGTAAVAFGVEGVKAAVDDAEAQAKLAKTLENTTKATQDQIAAVEDSIAALMQATGVADDELRPAYSALVIATKDTTTAQRLLEASLDASIGSGKNLQTVSEAVAKAIGGQTGSLKRLIPSLDTAALKGGDAEAVMRELNKAFGGQAATRAGTYAGKMDAVATAFGELQESFGAGLLSNLGGTSDSMGTMDDTLYSLGPAMEDLGATFGGIATSLAETARYIGPVVDGFNRLNDMGDGFLTNGVLVNSMQALARAQYVLARATGNDVAAMEAMSGTGVPVTINTADTAAVNGGDFGRNPYESYRPMRSRQRAADASKTADARAAQKDARTRQRP